MNKHLKFINVQHIRFYVQHIRFYVQHIRFYVQHIVHFVGLNIVIWVLMTQFRYIQSLRSDTHHNSWHACTRNSRGTDSTHTHTHTFPVQQCKQTAVYKTAASRQLGHNNPWIATATLRAAQRAYMRASNGIPPRNSCPRRPKNARATDLYDKPQRSKEMNFK